MARGTEYEETIRSIDRDLKYNKAELAKEIMWLEGTLAEIKRDAERGYHHEDLNIASQAARVQARTAKIDILAQAKAGLEASHNYFVSFPS